MDGELRPLVIVGVDGSPTSLQALRRAAVEARRYGAVLQVTHAYAIPAAALAPPGPDNRDCLVAAAREIIDTSLAEALGGLPGDLPVRRTVVANVPAGPALVGRVRSEDDLIVVGSSRRHPGQFWRRPVADYCVRHAVCPVLVVPPHQMLRELGGRSRMRRRDLDRLFAELLPGE
jgi:nucleotide-binding universal stress UspA family protein